MEDNQDDAMPLVSSLKCHNESFIRILEQPDYLCEADVELSGSYFDPVACHIDPSNSLNNEIQQIKDVGMTPSMHMDTSSQVIIEKSSKVLDHNAIENPSASILQQQAKDLTSHGQRSKLSAQQDKINIADPQDQKSFFVQSAMKNIETVWKWLYDEDVATIKIEGEVGIGKTWTAKHLRSKAELEAKLFDVVIWVDLANNVLPNEMVQMQILSQSKLVGRYNEEFKKDLTREELRQQISRALADKRYMLVLNDITSLNSCNLEDLGVPLPKEQNKSSKVLVTGRKSLTEHLITDKVLELKRLSEDEAWLLLQNVSSLEIDSPHRRELVKPWLEECNGYPSEIVNLGVSLDMLSTANFLNTKAHTDVLNLRSHAEVFLCQFLPTKNVRECFLYCSMYPSNHLFSVKGLLMSWIFEGFLGGFNSLKEANEKGESILKKLVDRCFLFRYDDYHVKINFLLRDRDYGSFRSGLFTLKYSHPLMSGQTLERRSLMNKNLQTIINEELTREKGSKVGMLLVSTGKREGGHEPESVSLENEDHLEEEHPDIGCIEPNSGLNSEIQHAYAEKYSPEHGQRITFKRPRVTDADMGSCMDSSKKKKLVDEQGSCSADDRLSSLPDNILHYIISFLPTKYAVGSSVLSTRWKHIWTSIHSFDFYDKLTYSGCKSINYTKRKKMFYDFVDRVLHVNDVPNVHKFMLTCKGCDAAHFNEWMSNIMSRKVQELLITITDPTMFPTCHWPFTCESLRILKIDIDDDIEILPSICFPSLKVLHLSNIGIMRLRSQSANDVSLSCPVLEDCMLHGCRWWGIKTVSISAPKLQMLNIFDWKDTPLQDCIITFVAESLISLKFKTTLVNGYSLLHLSSLIDAVVDIPDDIRDIDRVVSIFKWIFNVKVLSFPAKCIQALSHAAVLPHLQSLSRMTHLRVMRGWNMSIRVLIDFLCNMPNIEALSFPEGLLHTFVFKGQGRIIGTTPRCYLSHLKLIEITWFNWKNQDQQWFVKFLMKSVTNIDTLTVKIRRCPLGSPLAWMERAKELEDLAKVSNCILEYI